MESARLPIHGKTLTASFDGLLDRKLDKDRQSRDAIKQLRKIAFSHPEILQQVNSVIRILEGKDG